VNPDPTEHFCKEILDLEVGGSKIEDPAAGLTTDMEDGRWTIHSFDTRKSNKKETPSLKELSFPNNAGVMEIGKFYMECEDPRLMDKYEKLVFVSQDESRQQSVRDRAEYAAWKIIEKFNNVVFQGDGPWIKDYRHREREALKLTMLNQGT
jgi:hypothetical protein